VLASNVVARCHAVPFHTSMVAAENPLELRRDARLMDSCDRPVASTSNTMLLPFCPDPVTESACPATSPVSAFTSVPASEPSPPVNSVKLATPLPASACTVAGTVPERPLKFQLATTSARAEQAQSHTPAAPARVAATPRFIRCMSSSCC